MSWITDVGQAFGQYASYDLQKRQITSEANKTTPVQNVQAIDSQLNRSNVNKGGFDNQTMLIAGGAVVGLLVLVIALKK